MIAWTDDELRRVGRAEELQVFTLRRDGTLRPPVTIWVVRVGDENLHQVRLRPEQRLVPPRRTGLSPLLVAADYQYEFSEEALVQAIARHPDAQVVYNANPNGRPTVAATRYATQTGVEVLKFGELLRRIGRE